jgi:uncharacterized integral membrane protein (TIGR00697 family)
MSNELLLILLTLVNVASIFFAARRGVNWLFGTIILNLILSNIFGAKLITVFGFVANIGNVFYASVFLATYFLIERYGRSVGVISIQLGLFFTIFFVMISQLVLLSSGFDQNLEVNNAISTLFTFSPRVFLGSVIGYAFAQYVNISIYEWIRIRTKGKFLWLRSNVANIISQIIDSILFFSIAFPDLPGNLLVQAIFVGWLVKTMVVLLGTSFLYTDNYLNRK